MDRRFNLRTSNTEETGQINAAKKIGAPGIAALALVGALGLTTQAAAQQPDPFEMTFEAGQACSFRLFISLAGRQPVYREFYDKNGKLVRFLNAGRGTTNTYTNLDTGASVTLKPSGGSVSKGTVNEDGGLTTFVGTGFNGIISFPSDTPGASVMLYIGRVVYTIDASGSWTFIASSGKQTDICAMLS